MTTETMGKLSVRDTMIGTSGLVTTEVLVEAAQNPDYRRVEVAALYAVGLRYDFGQTDWRRVNEAIINRWSPAALKWIKERAWRAVERAGGEDGDEDD